MGLFERHKLLSFLGLALFLGRGACNTICPNGITNITASSGVLAYPSSGDYGMNETKCWMLEVPDTYKGIYINYNRFDMEICKDCKCDGFQGSGSLSSLPFVGKTCGWYTNNYLEARRLMGKPLGDEIPLTSVYLRFVSDDTVHRKGFNASYIAYSDKGGEKAYLNASEDETIEFGRPKVGIKNYPKDFEQQWYLIVPEGQQVQIDFDIFELEQSENCKNDYVEFREAYFDDNDPTDIEGYRGPILTGHLCGTTKPSSIQSAGNMVWVQFKSNDNSTTVHKGFKASFKAVSGGPRKLSVSSPLTLLFLSTLLMFASKNSLF